MAAVFVCVGRGSAENEPEKARGEVGRLEWRLVGGKDGCRDIRASAEGGKRHGASAWTHAP